MGLCEKNTKARKIYGQNIHTKALKKRVREANVENTTDFVIRSLNKLPLHSIS